MSSPTNKLTDIAVRKATPRDKPYKLADGGGLYLLVERVGAKYWRMAYRFAGKQKALAFGVYPEVTLKEASNARDEARRQLNNNVDPGQLRKIQKIIRIESAGNTFEVVALEWFSKQKITWAERHWTKVQWMLEKNLFPWIGARPIADISPPELLATLRRIESRGAIETAKRTKQVAGQVFRFAVATGRATRDPSHDLKGALATSVKKHLAAITDPKKVGPLLLMLDGYEGTAVVRAALRWRH